MSYWRSLTDMNKIKELYLKYKEVILYLFFGVTTTVLNLLIFWVFNDFILGEDLYLVSNIIAWILAAIFAYFVNKLFVFESKSWETKVALKELWEFLAARLFSFGVEEGGMFLVLDIFGFSEFSFDVMSYTVTGTLIAKGFFAVIVVILNYFFSKFIIFKKENKE